jgi:hypothetical protein
MTPFGRKQNADGRLFRAVTVRDDVFDALRAGRRRFVIKEFDEWNRDKFLRSPVTHVYVSRRTDRRGPALLFGVEEIGTVSLRTRTGWRDFIRIELSDGMTAVPPR